MGNWTSGVLLTPPPPESLIELNPVILKSVLKKCERTLIFNAGGNWECTTCNTALLWYFCVLQNMMCLNVSRGGNRLLPVIKISWSAIFHFSQSVCSLYVQPRQKFVLCQGLPVQKRHYWWHSSYSTWSVVNWLYWSFGFFKNENVWTESYICKCQNSRIHIWSWIERIRFHKAICYFCNEVYMLNINMYKNCNK